MTPGVRDGVVDALLPDDDFGGAVVNTGTFGNFGDVRTDVEIIAGGSGDDSITGSDAANTIYGGGGDDIIGGGGGTDLLDGGDGFDIATCTAAKSRTKPQPRRRR
jgi:Ca2+-binding RTX toxin-like protein